MTFLWSLVLLLVLCLFCLWFFFPSNVEKEKGLPEEQSLVVSSSSSSIQDMVTPQEEKVKESLPQKPPSPRPKQQPLQDPPASLSCRRIAHHFSLPESMVQKALGNNDGSQQDYPSLVYQLFVGCTDIPPLKKMELGTFLVWKSSYQEHIDHVYQCIVDMASNPRYGNKVRANAVDVLLRSNNRRYMDVANRELQRLRQEERRVDVQRIHNQMQQVRDAAASIHQQQQRRQLLPPNRPHQPLLQRLMITAPGARAFTPTTTTIAPLVDLRREDVRLQQALLNQYRRLERELEHEKKPTVYHDSQNVHNHAINESVIKSASTLVKDHKIPAGTSMDLEKELMDKHPEKEDSWRKSLRRIQTDATKFKDGMTLNEVLNKVVGVISTSPHRDELVRRLGEELVDMEGLCSTGHLSRIINVMQGFEETPEELRIKLNPKDEIYASMSSFLTSELQNADEQLLEDMIDPDVEKRKNYYDFMSEAINRKHLELQQEYNGVVPSKDLGAHIQEALRKYLNHEDDCRVILSQTGLLVPAPST